MCNKAISRNSPRLCKHFNMLNYPKIFFFLPQLKCGHPPFQNPVLHWWSSIQAYLPSSIHQMFDKWMWKYNQCSEWLHLIRSQIMEGKRLAFYRGRSIMINLKFGRTPLLVPIKTIGHVYSREQRLGMAYTFIITIYI